MFNTIFAVVVAGNVGRYVLRVLRERRRDHQEQVLQLHALNSHSILSTPLDQRPSSTTPGQRDVLHCEAHKSPKAALLSRNHRAFVAKWARAAKGRFSFASQCDDSALNQAALHRWFRSQWTKIGMSDVEVSLYIDDAIALAFEPTVEKFLVESRKKVRARARMEYYNERKALSVIK